MHPFFHMISFCVFFSPVANSYQINQSKKFSLLSQLALSSQTKFFLKSPPKSRKKAGAGQAAGFPDAHLAAELDSEAETSEGQSPLGQYENCLSPGLDFAISDLVSLDSQAEVEQGISLREGTSTWEAFLSVLVYTVSKSKTSMLLFQKASFPFPLFVFFHNWFIRKQGSHFQNWGIVHKSGPSFCFQIHNPD